MRAHGFVHARYRLSVMAVSVDEKVLSSPGFDISLVSGVWGIFLVAFDHLHSCSGEMPIQGPHRAVFIIELLLCYLFIKYMLC